jgi:hypothetical protein
MATVMTFEVEAAFDIIDIASCFPFVLLRVTTERTTEVVQLIRLACKSFKLR